MRPQANLCWLAILLLAAPLAPAAPVDEEEPTYQGRPLSVWLKRLRSDGPKGRAEAAVALDESIGPGGKAAVPALIDALKDGDSVVHSRAASALGKIGPAAKAAAPALIATLKDKEKDFITRAHAARSLGKIGAEARAVVPALIEALADEEANVRTDAAHALGDIGPEARDAVPALRRAFQKGDFFVASSVVQALGHIGKPGVPALVEALDSKNEFLRELAASALGKIGPDAREATPTLIGMLKKEDRNDRTRAAQALGRIGPGAKTAVPALREAVKDENGDVREAAAWAFVRIDPEAARQAGVREPPPKYLAFVDADGKDFDRDDNASAGGGEIGGRVVLWVNGERAGDYSGGGQVLDLAKWLRPGKNELTVSGRHERAVYVKVTKYTGGGFERLAGKRKFPGPGGEGKAEPLTLEVERAPKP